VILQSGPTPETGYMMAQQPNMMNTAVWFAYFLLGLGVVVLFTGLYMLGMRMMRHQRTLGMLMVLYGAIMLILGVGMIGQMLVVMMVESSMFSGGVMIIFGVLMLYSGVSMAKR
jgi:hypothetical protein